MTENQTNAVMKSPNTKKAIAVLQKFALTEAAYKAAEKESKASAELIKQAMIDNGIEKLDINMPGLTGFITLATRTSYKADDLDDVADDYLKSVLDIDKVKAQAVLTGALPEGVVESQTQYIIKKFKVEK